MALFSIIRISDFFAKGMATVSFYLGDLMSFIHMFSIKIITFVFVIHIRTFNTMKKSFISSGFLAALAASVLFASCKTINTVNDSHFDKKGYALDSIRTSFQAQAPSALGFYVEVSGSMNGFFRSNQATRFKKDVWSIVSNFGGNDVAILSNEGTVAGTYRVEDFRTRMNRGGFVSNKETMVPQMVNSILKGLDYNNGQCAVLISDMKYSPERQQDVKVLLAQYQEDIRNEIGKYPGIAICMIMATSDYLSVNNKVVAEDSPYYYVIFGKDTNVAFMRNHIATILEDNGNYRESIEMGFEYKSPSYSFGIPDNAIQLFTEPTFIGYNTDFSDTCRVNLKLDLTDFRWKIVDESILRQSISAESCYGSKVSIGNVTVDVTNHFNNGFERKANATIELKIFDMLATDSDVIEWSLNHPDKVISNDFSQIISCPTESDLSGSFSVDRFIGGVFNAIQNDWDKTPNRILVSKKN